MAVPASASEYDTLTIYCEVKPINEFSISDPEVSLIVAEPLPGHDFRPATGETAYNITTNCGTDSKKITASLNSDMPSGTTLELMADAPSGATGQGYKVLGASPADIVTGIDSSAESNIALTFRFSTSIKTQNPGQGIRTVTLTLANSS